MMMRKAIVAGSMATWAIAMVGGQQPAQSAQPKQVIQDAQLREWAEHASKKAFGDTDVFTTELTNLIRIQESSYWPQAGLPFVVIHSDDAIKIYATGPLANFHFSAQERARRLEPIGALGMKPEVEISVSPDQIGAPDYSRVVLRRGDAIIQPLRTTLKPELFETRMGAKRTIHSGSVFYPLSAFAHGELVTVLLIPTTGSNLVRPIHGPEIDKLIIGFSFGEVR